MGGWVSLPSSHGKEKLCIVRALRDGDFFRVCLEFKILVTLVKYTMRHSVKQKRVHRIVIVDDKPENLQLIGKILLDRGFLISVARNGSQALELIHKNLPDLILLDILMPGMDGVEVCRRLKEDSRTREIPVIFLTGLSDTSNKIKAFNAGAVDYITKPINAEEALARIKTHLTIGSLHAQLENTNEKLEEKVRRRTRELGEKNRALLESEEKYRCLVENLRNDYFFYSHGVDGLFTYMSPSAEKILGYPRTELLGHFAEYHTENPVNRDVERSTRLSMKGVQQPPYEVELHHGDGSVVNVEVSEVPVLDEKGAVHHVDGIARDITERKRAEVELKRLRNLLSNIMNSMPTAIIGIDGDGKISQWNREAEKMTGAPSDKALGRTLPEVFPQLDVDMEKIRAALLERQTVENTRIVGKIDGEPRRLDMAVYPLVGDGVEGAVIRVDDVTERIRLEEMMIQSEKMLSVGGLAAGMAHEINNPLAGIIQNMQVIRNRFNKKAPKNMRVAVESGVSMEGLGEYMTRRGLFTMMDTVAESGKRAAKIVENMLSFSRKGDARFSNHDLGRLLDETIELASKDYDLKKKYDFRIIEIKRRYDETAPRVPCEGSKIQQVFLNILRNGAEAMTGDEDRTAAPCFTLRVTADETMARVEIRDNGPGMEETTRKRIFEPFFTTKGLGVGTGLGLSVSYFIITDNHKGKIAVESTPGDGAAFIIQLPLKNAI